MILLSLKFQNGQAPECFHNLQHKVNSSFSKSIPQTREVAILINPTLSVKKMSCGIGNFHYANPTRILFGRGQIAQLPNLIDKDRLVFMTYGGGSTK